MISQEIVREFLDYDSDTGKLTWKERARRWFKSDKSCHTWNTRFAKKEAFTVSSYGYFRIRILGKAYQLHRVIWLYQTGEWPKEQVDHINHNRADNRWFNLREASNQENGKNRTRQRNNSSGYTGVGWDRQKWYSKIVINKKYIFLGYFDLLENAVRARKEAEVKYGFSENHGR